MTPAQIRTIKEMRERGESNAAICAAFNLSSGNLHHIMKKNGIPMKKVRRITAEQKEAMRKLWMDLVPPRKIAERFDMKPDAVSQYARRQGWPLQTAIRAQAQSGPKKAETPAVVDNSLAAQIKRTGGRWAALAAVADANGLTLREVQYKWHRVAPTIATPL